MLLTVMSSSVGRRFVGALTTVEARDCRRLRESQIQAVKYKRHNLLRPKHIQVFSQEVQLQLSELGVNRRERLR